MRCIHPFVRIMKIEHEISSGSLDALTQCRYVRQVLTYGIIRFSFRFLLWIDENTHAEHVPSAVIYEEWNHVLNLGAVNIPIRPVVFFILRQHRDVSAYVACLRLRVCAYERNKE